MSNIPNEAEALIRRRNHLVDTMEQLFLTINPSHPVYMPIYRAICREMDRIDQELDLANH